MTLVLSRSNNHHFTTSALLHFKLFIKKKPQLCSCFPTSAVLHQQLRQLDTTHCPTLPRAVNGEQFWFETTDGFYFYSALFNFRVPSPSPEISYIYKHFVPRSLIWGYVQPVESELFFTLAHPYNQSLISKMIQL